MLISSRDQKKEMRDEQHGVIKTHANRRVSFLRWPGPAEYTYILLHGFPDRADIWKPLAFFLKEQGQVIAFDLPDPKTSDSFLSVGLDLIEAISKLLKKKKTKLVLIGHDVGSVYAWWLAGHVLDQKDFLITINGAHPQEFLYRLKNPIQYMKSWYMPLMLIKPVRYLLIKKLGKLIMNYYGRFQNIVPIDFDAALNQAEYYNLIFTYFLSGGEFTPSRNPLVARTLVFQASDEPFLTPPRIDKIKQFSLSVRYRELAGGHWLQLTQPEALARLINKEILNEAA